MTEESLKIGHSYDFNGQVVMVCRVTDSTVFYTPAVLPDGVKQKPQFVRKNTFLSRAKEMPQEPKDPNVYKVTAMEVTTDKGTIKLGPGMLTIGNLQGTTTGRVSAQEPQNSNPPMPEHPKELKTLLDKAKKMELALQQISGDPITHGEPDFEKFTHNGLTCCVIRHPTMGHLCGYVKVPPSTLLKHLKGCKKVTNRLKPIPGVDRDRWKKSSFGKVQKKQGYRHHDLREVGVHGGLTFFGKPFNVKTQRGMWLGFDAAHCDDLIPTMPLTIREDSIYADFEYMKAHCRALACHIKNLIEKETK